MPVFTEKWNPARARACCRPRTPDMLMQLLPLAAAATSGSLSSPLYRDPLFDGAHDPEIVRAKLAAGRTAAGGGRGGLLKFS